MFLQLKSGYNTDQRPCWIARVRFSKSWQSTRFHGLTLHREQGVDGNFVEVQSGNDRQEVDAVGHEREMTRHLHVAAAVAESLARRDDVEAVLLGGSVGRGEHQASSDIDLLIVSTDAFALPVRETYGELLVERIAHTEGDWLGRFDRPKTSWLYAFLEANVLFDSGAAERLRHQARTVQATYRASPELKSLLATWLWHGQAKLDRVQPEDAELQGFFSSVFVETIIDGLYTVHDVPLPAGSRRMAHLSLVAMTAREQRDLHSLLTGGTADRFEAAQRLVGGLRDQLGPADHET
jgi:predicted nucleotidyltransferase